MAKSSTKTAKSAKSAKSAKAAKVAKFDPTKQYKWEADSQFTLTGVEFEMVFKTLQEQASAPTGTSPLNIVTAYKIMESLFIKSVESGVSVEVEEEEMN